MELSDWFHWLINKKEQLNKQTKPIQSTITCGWLVVWCCLNGNELNCIITVILAKIKFERQTQPATKQPPPAIHFTFPFHFISFQRSNEFAWVALLASLLYWLIHSQIIHKFIICSFINQLYCNKNESKSTLRKAMEQREMKSWPFNQRERWINGQWVMCFHSSSQPFAPLAFLL